MMKLVWVACLLLCALVHANFGASQPGQNVQDVNFNLGSTVLDVHLLVPEHEVTAEDEQLIQKLSSAQRNLLGHLIKKTLESFRPIVINGNAILPPLDPFHLDVLGPFDYKVAGILASVQINDFRVEGLSLYVIDSVVFSPLRLTLGIHITQPRLTFTGNYEARAAILMINHRATANYRIVINSFEMGVDMRLGANLAGGHLVLRELEIKLDIHDTQIELTGMTGSNVINSFISNLVNSLTQNLIQNQMEKLSRILSEQLFDIINEFLKKFSLGDILG